MPRRRWIIALAIVVPLLAALEYFGRRWERPRATVKIINEGGGIMEDLVVVYNETRMPVGDLLKGQSAHVRLTAGPVGPLRLEFRQKSNALQGLEIPDFEPDQLLEIGYMQVLVVGVNQVTRYAEEDETRTDGGTLGQSLLKWFRSELGLRP